MLARTTKTPPKRTSSAVTMARSMRTPKPKRARRRKLKLTITPIRERVRASTPSPGVKAPACALVANAEEKTFSQRREADLVAFMDARVPDRTRKLLERDKRRKDKNPRLSDFANSAELEAWITTNICKPVKVNDIHPVGVEIKLADTHTIRHRLATITKQLVLAKHYRELYRLFREGGKDKLARYVTANKLGDDARIGSNIRNLRWEREENDDYWGLMDIADPIKWSAKDGKEAKAQFAATQ